MLRRGQKVETLRSRIVRCCVNITIVLKGMHEEIKATIVDTGTYKINVDCSIGLTSYPALCSNPDILVSRADKAMYYSKRHGRGQLIVDNPMIDEDLKEENDL